ncbi:MAG: hypothetical protein PUK26_05925, partial [Lachnoclostridium sp.]|nr:hypothetical protein [Lachnoclostridium sp.]
MRAETEEVVKSTIDDMDQNVLRAVYALNMCTVSVSQIIDYNDVYILEQEYDAILNNLNLEKMPKADALKKILVELLNTITFFRIQEIRKKEIEEQYQRRMKNAIWSAVPNINMIVSGKPLAIAFSIASQVGIGYMNYRKEKNKIADERHKEELELKITAIEQFHALRRELFTTAWELAEEYNFEDRLRLTEKQIKQYNQILMDQNELRKYERLEAIAEKFEAFPPFWYHFGHTAASIAGDKSLNLYDNQRKEFREKAKNHFSHYEKLNKFNILREDQMTAAFALEYVDLLLLEKDKDTEENEKKNKIRKLIDIANNMSGTFLDIKQLCVIAYLKIGSTKEAAALLKQLVNEEYNTITNAKILSRIYISEYLESGDAKAKLEYNVLKMRVGEKKERYLFPMPQLGEGSNDLSKQYLEQLKYCVKDDFNTVIYQWVQKYVLEINALIPAPYGYESYEDYYCNSKSAFTKRDDDIIRILKDTNQKTEYLQRLENAELGHGLIDTLNNSL